MKLFITVTPNARTESVAQKDEHHYTVKVNAPPTDGKANTAAIRLLTQHFNIPKSRITLLSGHTSRKKIVEII